jgi:hypothetical protein
VANPQEAGPPLDTANVTPMDGGTAQTRQIVEAVKASVSELRQDVRDIKEYRYTDLWRQIGAFAAGIVFVVSAMVAAYLRLDDKLSSLSISNTRLETKLEDLLARIPPVPTPPPQRKP